MSCDATNDWLLSVAQDMRFCVSKGKLLTPKHVGLALSLHQATRSKKLINLFYKAGHVVSYKHVLNLDTAMAQSVLDDLDPATGGIVPQNIVPDRFVQFSADNIDILDASLDGKNTFHATQMTAWQRGPPADMVSLNNLHCRTNGKLNVPHTFHTCIVPPHYPSNVIIPVISVEKEWYKNVEIPPTAVSNAVGKDLAFSLIRSQQPVKQGWTHFNQEASTTEHEQTTTGYMPIILAPAHEYDTLYTVVQRCKYVAETNGQKFVVLTVDEALYCRLMELKWANDEIQEILIPRLGGLHTAMNFLKAIGQHMNSTGLLDLWIDSDLMGSKTALNVLEGKGYEKAVRAHKLTFQAIWQILLPQLLEYVSEEDGDLRNLIDAALNANDVLALQNILTQARFSDMLTYFQEKHQDDANFCLWWQYLNMVQVLLFFIRAQRDADWDLHLEAFRRMLPYFHRYDHTNYAKWGTVYLAEMNQLPQEVEEEFKAGNFVVKASQLKFNQVDPDHAQEWLNGTCKKSGGIIGITKTLAALDRWSLSFTLRAKVVQDTHQLFGSTLDESLQHKEGGPSRRLHDEKDEDNLVKYLTQYGFLKPDRRGKVLENVATKEQATAAITESLLQAESLGQRQLEQFVSERFSVDGEAPTKNLHATLSKNKPLTMASIYETPTIAESRAKVAKVDRSILQRLVVAFEGGRKIDLADILKHELTPVPLSIAELNGTLRTGQKSLIIEELTKTVQCPVAVQVPGEARDATLIIDGMAVVNSLGPPKSLKTFGDYSIHFCQSVFLCWIKV